MQKRHKKRYGIVILVKSSSQDCAFSKSELLILVKSSVQDCDFSKVGIALFDLKSKS